MKTGIELIREERQEQITKHGRIINDDVKFNISGQLADGAYGLIEFSDEEYPSDRISYFKPPGWDSKIWEHMCKKSYKDRLIIAGALIAAEIDRIQRIL